MSSLTSPSVNKNITRFAPKVKHRERRSSLKSVHGSTSERPTISTTSFTSQRLSAPTTSTSKTVQPSLSASSRSATPSSTPIKPPLKSSPSKSKPIPSIRNPQLRSSRRLSSTSSVTFQVPPKGDHIVVVSPPSPDPDKLPAVIPTTTTTITTAAATTTPSTTATSTAVPILHDTVISPQPKKRRRRSSSTHDTELVETLTTLDDITHDPAEPSLLQKPMSYFTDDLSTGVVSRSYKDNERKRAAAAVESGSIKTIKNDNASGNSIEILNDPDTHDEKSSIQESASAPQVRLVDGEIVLDTSSLYIDKPLGQRQPVNYEVVEEDNTSKRINSHTHGKLHGGHRKRWTKAETDLFYQGLARHGTDFEMITTMIPSRTRKEIKNMFNRQEKVCPWKITASIMKKSISPTPDSQYGVSQEQAAE